MRPGFEVVRAVFLHLGLEAGGAPPVDIFSPVVGEHFLGRLKLRGRHPEDLQHVLGGVTAKQIRPDHEPGIVIHETDDIGVLAPQTERENVRLPHLVGGGPLKETGPGEVAPGFGRTLHQALLLEGLAHRLGAGRKEKDPAQQLGNPFDPA
jgi:hypothetical protein